MINHLSIIMDGNRRWAEKQKLKPWLGHEQGIKTVKTAISYCLKSNIKHLSLYTFSLENFKRTGIEKLYLFKLIIKSCSNFLNMFINNNINVKFIGNLDKFPEDVKQSCIKLEQKTLNSNPKLSIYILLGYGGRQEILHAIKSIAQDIQNKSISSPQITEENIKSYLWTASIPDPELIIRSGGFKRLSNLLLYQSAYSELRFTNTLWPELTEKELSNICEEYNNTKRKFGI